MADEMRCGTCSFYLVIGAVTEGKCNRFPPQWLLTVTDKGGIQPACDFPLTKNTNLCGEYKARPEA